MELKVNEALIEDVGKGLARLDPEDIKALNATLGDVIEISGKNKTVARITGCLDADRGKNLIQIDGITRGNARINVSDTVKIKKVPRKTASTVAMYPLGSESTLLQERDLEHFGKILQGLAIVQGDKMNVPLFGGKDRFFKIEETSPSGALIITQQTKFVLRKAEYGETSLKVSYEDVGGLDNELRLVREMVELPLRHAEVFDRLGIEAPKGILLYGPPGTGKTLIAKAIASESKLHFIKVNGPEIIHKFYGESEARLRDIFEEASNRAPSVIFIDEIDAIAPKRADVLGDVEKRVVAQLLALMDGMVSRGHVIVIGATNIPEMIDPALRRPGRFDREIVIQAPNVEGRLAILKIHSRLMPLSPEVDLRRIAQMTHGFVGADLEALCKEAGMITLRRYISQGSGNNIDSIVNKPEQLHIIMEDFLNALLEIEPSATREFYTERSHVKWKDIGGLKKIKETLISIIDWPCKYQELFSAGKVSPPRGILFIGPTGTGKTLMAKALAGETGLNFISINGPILFSKWLGESEKALHEIFKKAKQSAPCILFFDEMDALVTRRGTSYDSGTAERMGTQFFNELDKLSDISQLIVLGATNREDLIDPALLRSGRFDFVLRFSIPDEEDRLDIFKVHIREKPLSSDIDLRELAKRTEGMDGARIASICNRATIIAIAEIINSRQRRGPSELKITRGHFEAAIMEVSDKKEVLVC